MKSKVDDLWLWLDLEMAGLDPMTCPILEVAALITDNDFDEIDSFEQVIAVDQEQIERMKSRSLLIWEGDRRVPSKQSLYDVHLASGLITKVASAKRNERQTEKDFLRFMDGHFSEGRIALAGNSIHNDRHFIIHRWPEVDRRLHYRMLDVSSFKILLTRLGVTPPVGNDDHRALGDIRDSIKEMRYYLKYWHLPQPTKPSGNTT